MEYRKYIEIQLGRESFFQSKTHLESYWCVLRFGEARVLQMAGSEPEKSVGAPVKSPPVGPLANKAVTFACGE